MIRANSAAMLRVFIFLMTLEVRDEVSSRHVSQPLNGARAVLVSRYIRLGGRRLYEIMKAHAKDQRSRGDPTEWDPHHGTDERHRTLDQR